MVTSQENYFLISKKNSNRIYHKTLAISHGSGGLSLSEVKIADFFLEKGFEIQLFDHFTPLRISKLNWGHTNELLDTYSTTLLELIETMESLQCVSKYHLGFSLGGYLGINNSHLFKGVFCCYPGVLPFIKKRIVENREKIYIFEGSEDSWTKFPNELKSLISKRNLLTIDGAHHSFMSFNKDKDCQVYSYEFDDLLTDRNTLAQIQLNHLSIAKFGTFKKVTSKNKTHHAGMNIVLNKILKEIEKNEQ